MTLLRVLALSFFLAGLVGCGPKAAWLQGEWVVDRKMTDEKLQIATKAEAKKDGGIGGALRQLADSMGAGLLLAKVEDARITITSEEIITTISGNGTAVAYEVLETPDANTVVIKKANGEVETYHREGDHIYTAASGVPLTLYLKRAP